MSELFSIVHAPFSALIYVPRPVDDVMLAVVAVLLCSHLFFMVAAELASTVVVLCRLGLKAFPSGFAYPNHYINKEGLHPTNNPHALLSHEPGPFDCRGVSDS